MAGSRKRKRLNEGDIQEELLQMLLDIVENRRLDLENDVGLNKNDLYYWFQHCRGMRYSDVLSIGSKVLNCQNNHEIHKLISDLRDHLLLHNWQDAKEVLDNLVSTSCYESRYVFLRVGLELIYRLNSGPQSFDSIAELVKKIGNNLDEDLIDLFNFKLMTRLPDGIKDKVGVEALNDTFDLMSVSANTKTKVRPKNPSLIEVSSDLMYSYYYPGLVAYSNWSAVRSRMHDEESTEDDIRNELKKAAERAIRYFSECEKYEGVWDVVVAKHLEILEHHADVERDPGLLLQAELLLKDHQDSSDSDLNALKMLYKFYRRHEGTFEASQAVATLLEIRKRSPSDVLMLELVSSHSGEVGFSGLEVLFDLLDDETWRKNEMPWSLLAARLVDGLSDEGGMEEFMVSLRTCWEFRRDWWPEYHFHEWTELKSPGLDLCRAVVAVVLLGRECILYRNVVRLLKTSPVESDKVDLLKRARSLKISRTGLV